MKIEDLQNKLQVSRTTLYRYMKGINRITPDMAEKFIWALDMDAQQSAEFSKYISLSAFDQSLLESRLVLDDFLFGKQQKPNPGFDIDMIFYNNDKYLRTLKEILGFIRTFGRKDAVQGEVKMLNCLDKNLFLLISEHVENAFAAGSNFNVEHFVALSETDYLQNTNSFTHIFPLIKYEKYKLYLREKETEDSIMHDSILVSVTYNENGAQVNQYFSINFYENGMPECATFNDSYIYSYLLRNYNNLKFTYQEVIKDYENMDFTYDIFLEMQKTGDSYLLKSNPCYNKVPAEVYQSLMNRMSSYERNELLTTLSGEEVDDASSADAIEKVIQHLMKSVGEARTTGQTDVYSREGLVSFAQTGRLTDHIEQLPDFNRDEKRMVLEYLYKCSNEQGNNYTLYITESEMPCKDFILAAIKDFGLLIGYIYPELREGLWKMVTVKSSRLASIFSDYLENHIPVNHAMDKEKANSLLRDLLDEC